MINENFNVGDSVTVAGNIESVSLENEPAIVVVDHADGTFTVRLTNKQNQIGRFLRRELTLLKKKENSLIQYGDVDLLDEDLKDENVFLSIAPPMIRMDIYKKLRKEAKAKGIKVKELVAEIVHSYVEKN